MVATNLATESTNRCVAVAMLLCIHAATQTSQPDIHASTLLCAQKVVAQVHHSLGE